jgi:hypothetical protein
MDNVDLTPLEARRIEVDAYTQNIAMYTALYETLPHEWPEHLAEYRQMNEHEAAGLVDDIEDVMLLSQLFQSDSVYKAIRTEMMERTKAAGILAMMELQA